MATRKQARLTEADLSHDADPNRFALALTTICQGGAGAFLCSEKGFCLHGGDCFKGSQRRKTRQELAYEVRRLRLLLKESELLNKRLGDRLVALGQPLVITGNDPPAIIPKPLRANQRNY